MKIRKASMIETLSLILLFTMFSAFITVFVFNNSAQERRSLLVDFLNKEAMSLQAKLEGYSDYEDYCYMYRDGSKVTFDKAKRIKSDEINLTISRIKDYFKNERVASILSLSDSNPVIVEIIDSDDVKASATIKITVNFNMKYRSAYSNSESDFGSNQSGSLELTEVVTRVIENPVRAKNLK